jgi:hypothetical protein
MTDQIKTSEPITTPEVKKTARERQVEAQRRYDTKNMPLLRIRRKAIRDKNKEEKRFHCDVCNVSVGMFSSLGRHNKSKKHIARGLTSTSE